MINPEPDFYACLSFDCFLKNELHVFANIIMQRMQLSEVTFIQESFVFKIYNLLFQVWSYSYSEHQCSLTKLRSFKNYFFYHAKVTSSYHFCVECFSQLSFDSEVYTKSAAVADFVYTSESNESCEKHSTQR